MRWLDAHDECPCCVAVLVVDGSYAYRSPVPKPSSAAVEHDLLGPQFNARVGSRSGYFPVVKRPSPVLAEGSSAARNAEKKRGRQEKKKAKLASASASALDTAATPPKKRKKNGEQGTVTATEATPGLRLVPLVHRPLVWTPPAVVEV